MISRQAVHESFIIVETLPIWTQVVELSYEGETRQTFVKQFTRYMINIEYDKVIIVQEIQALVKKL